MNPHFATADTWDAAAELVPFTPRVPRETLGHALQSLAVYVRDYKQRDVTPGQRSVEAHYGAFVFSQSRPGKSEARRLALTVSYGGQPIEASIRGRPARYYERGPEVAPNDPDGRTPAVVVWYDGEMFYLVASETRTHDELALVGSSIHRTR